MGVVGIGDLVSGCQGGKSEKVVVGVDKGKQQLVVCQGIVQWICQNKVEWYQGVKEKIQCNIEKVVCICEFVLLCQSVVQVIQQVVKENGCQCCVILFQCQKGQSQYVDGKIDQCQFVW